MPLFSQDAIEAHPLGDGGGTLGPVPASKGGPPARPGRRGAALGLLVLAAWFGLVAGWLEVAAKFACVALDVHGRLFLMSRHFVWLVPVANAILFVAVALPLALIAWLFPRVGSRVGVMVLSALAIAPPLIVLTPGVYTASWVALGFGLAVTFGPVVERRAPSFGRVVAWSLPALAVAVAATAGWAVAKQSAMRSREEARPMPPSGTPNVLLIVLDTVRADRLSAYGYARDTTPTLEFLAGQGVRFDAARSTCSWTLPSHGSMFTGRLPHELGADWLEPLRSGFPTLAGYLGERGYATAGFVGNTLYCSYDTGLAEGFTHYEDYPLQQMEFLLMPRLGERAIQGFFGLSSWAHARGGGAILAPFERFVQRFVYSARRKDAATVNRDFLRWLSGRAQPDRPFFAFLNYIDAHDAYFPPAWKDYRFGHKPAGPEDFQVLQDWESIDKTKLPARYRALASDCYDDCIRSIDDQLRALFVSLASRRLLDNTLVIVTSDHGESFGEHGTYRHGNTLYSPEIHVPLLIKPHAPRPARKIVPEVVTLADLPATVVDLVGFQKGAPFPGRSLARTWQGEEAAGAAAVSELRSPNPVDIGHQKPSPAAVGRVIALTSDRYKYITNGREEELYDVASDPNERHNRVGDASLRDVLERFRAEARRLRLS